MSNSFVVNLLPKPTEYVTQADLTYDYNRSCVLKGYFTHDISEIDEDYHPETVDLLINETDLETFFTKAGYGAPVVSTRYQPGTEEGPNAPSYIRISFSLDDGGGVV